MKKVILLVLLIPSFIASFAQTADEVVNKFIEVSGGKEKLKAIKTLQYTQVAKASLPIGIIEIPIENYKDNGKFYRMDGSVSFGGQTMNFFAVVNDTAGYVMVPANPMMGTQGGLKKMDEKERAGNQFQLDAAGLFAGLVDYSAKGNKLDLLGDAKANKEDCYKIKMTLPSGQDVTYYISKATNLIVKMDAKGVMAANLSGLGPLMNSMGSSRQIEKLDLSSIYSNYQNIDGVMFPTKMVVRAPMGDVESTLANFKINKPIDPKLYEAK